MSTCVCVCGVSKCAGMAVSVHEPPSCAPMCLSVRLTQLEEPAFAVRVEEGVSEVIAVVLRNGEGLTLDAVEEVLPRERRKGKAWL